MGNAKALKRPATTAGFTPVIKKTAAYTVKNSEAGSLFTWNSTTSFNFTLPPVNKANAGVYFDFAVEQLTSSGGHGVTPNSADKIFFSVANVAKTDGQSVVISAASDQIGDGFRLISDGVDGWRLVFGRGTFA